jgi:hypothetical protein
MVPGFYQVAMHSALVCVLRHVARGQFKMVHTGEIPLPRVFMLKVELESTQDSTQQIRGYNVSW